MALCCRFRRIRTPIHGNRVNPGRLYRKGPHRMRKNITFLLGTATGVCMTLLVAGPQQLATAAKAAVESGTYSKLNLFGDVFERVRTDYVEKPDDSKLMEGASNGVISW